MLYASIDARLGNCPGIFSSCILAPPKGPVQISDSGIFIDSTSREYVKKNNVDVFYCSYVPDVARTELLRRRNE